MKNVATWCVLAAMLVAAGWGLREAAGQSKDGGFGKKPLPGKKTKPDEVNAAKTVGDAFKKVVDAAAKNPYALYGEEAALCMERFHAALADQLTPLDKFWRTAMPKDKNAQEEWQAMASALYEDLVLYGRSAVDAAKDARKDKKCRATESDVTRLKSQVENTIKLADHVFRKKGLDVATYRERAQRAVDTMKGFKSSMPMIQTRLVADLAYASDIAISVHKGLQSDDLTLTDLDMDVRGMELARRSVQAVKTVGLIRRAGLVVTMKAMAPEVMLAACQKAIENWVPADLTAGTLLTAKQTENIQAWPAYVEWMFGKGYAPFFEEGRKAVAPFVDATFHQISLFKNTALADLDKALDPFVNEVKAALEARRAMEASEKDADQADKLTDEELKNTRSAGKKTSELFRAVGDKLKDMQIKNLYEADRRRYQALGQKCAELAVKHQKLQEDIQQKESELEREKTRYLVSKTSKGKGKLAGQALKAHLASSAILRMSLIKLREQYEQVGSDLEEVAEEIQTMRIELRS